MRIGLLTGGGDCPGLNAAIRAVVLTASAAGDETVGFHHGWKGVVEGDAEVLTADSTRGILQSGGTMLRTARYHPDEHEGGIGAVQDSIERQRLDVLVVVGGDGTLGSASRLARVGVPIVGIPKTIDNDVAGTARCIGFDTAVSTAAEAIDRVHTTGESHDRVMVVEVMGRSTGWLAIYAGLAAGANAICLPERRANLHDLAKALQSHHEAGSSSSVVVVAEGAQFSDCDGFGSRSVGTTVASELVGLTGYETRLTVLGHIQRGGMPSAADRVLATRFGVAAVAAAHDRAFSSLVRWRDDTVDLCPLEVVRDGPRPVPARLLQVMSGLTIC